MGKVKDKLLKPFRERESRSPSPQPRSSLTPPRPATAVASSPRVPPAKSQQNASLELAIQKHLDKLPEADKDSFREASKTLTEATLLSRAKEYDSRYQKQSAFRPRAEGISKFLRTLDQFMGGVTIGLQSKPEISALVVGGVRLIIDFAVRFVTFFIKLTDMICHLTDYLEPLKKYAESKDPVIIEEIAAAYGDILEFCRQVRGVFMNGEEVKRWTSVRTFIHMQWEPFETRFGDINSNFQHHVKIIQLSASASQLVETHRGNLEAELERRRVRMREKADEKEEFLKWLDAPDFEKRHLDIYAKKHSQTGTWLLDRKEFKRWVDSSGQSLLWIYGKPGVGKSVLASNVIEHISEQYALDESVGFSYVYYDYRNEKLQDLSLVIAGIMKQICCQKKDIPDWLLKYKQDCHTPSTVCTTESFCKMGQDFGRIIIVVDALDECPKEERHKIIGFILDSVRELNARNLNTKVLVTSRREGDILEAFQSSNIPMFEIQAKNVMGDIEIFVRDEVKRLRKSCNGKKLHLKDDSLEDTVIRALIDQSEGMFLWTNLQLESLCQISEARKDSLVQEALKDLPEDLDATYIRILRQIEDKRPYMRHLALKTFMWVFHAKRPLSEMELRYALAVRDSIASHDDLRRDRHETDVIMDACANLIINENGTIRPIHYSVQEFITNNKSETPYLAALQNVSNVNENLAKSCLLYLHLTFGSLNSPHLDYILACQPFLLYAAKYFDHHLEGTRAVTGQIDHAIEAIFQQSNRISTLLQIRSLSDAWRVSDLDASSDLTFKPNANALLYSTHLFKIPSLRDKFGSGDPPNLNLAAQGGHLDLAIQLIQEGCPVDDRDENDMFPLYHACDRGHLSIVSLLLDHKADINMQGGPHSSSLLIASARGYETIVRMLLEKGADVNAQDDFYGNALQAASAHGYEKIARILLEKEADVNAQGDRYGNALQAASAHGYENIARMLLDKEADVNAQGGHYGNALQIALEEGHEEIVRMLLDKGADVNAQYDFYGNALQIASEEGYEKIVRILLEKGADINAQGGQYGYALQAASASFRQSEEIVKLLLDQGADINAQGGGYGSALQAATSKGHEETVKLLLDRGADINARGGEYGNALQAAAASHFGREDIVKLLLDQGADINAQGGGYGSALQAATSKGHEETVKLLLDRGADIDSQDKEYESALQTAASKGHEEIVKLLLDRGAKALPSAPEEYLAT